MKETLAQVRYCTFHHFRNGDGRRLIKHRKNNLDRVSFDYAYKLPVPVSVVFSFCVCFG